MELDREYRPNDPNVLFWRIDEILWITCKSSENIIIYTYMLNNKNVSNNFKHGLFDFFIKKCQHTLSDKFTLYKNILECYLTLSKCYRYAFPKHKLLENLSHDDSKQLHMFLSVADPSALKNLQLTNLLNNNHSDTIKDYLTKKYVYNLKCIKNVNIYLHLSPKNLFVVDYDKIIKKINANNINIIKRNDLMILILSYFTINELLALSNDKLEVKLEVKYLNIDLKFYGPESAKLLKNNHNDIIKNYVIKDTTHNFKCIKNFNIYSHLLSNNVFVVDYTKIIKKINENNINIMKNDDLMRLVLCYFTIEDLLALYKDKLEVKYLNIDLEFHRPGGYISTGIQALVDAIKSNNGSLSNTGKYHTFDTAYNLLDIDLNLDNKLIEVREVIEVIK